MSSTPPENLLVAGVYPATFSHPDSAQSERSKDEKHFGKRVQQYVKLLKGKRLQQAT
jgi:hypothetical protein